MSVETELQALTTNVTTLIGNVNAQQALINTNKSSWDGAIVDLATLTASGIVTNNLHIADNTATNTAIALKQDILESGTNIRTINGASILGSTDLIITVTSVSSITVAYDSRNTLRSNPSNPNQINDRVSVEGLGSFMWSTTSTEPDDDETCFTSVTNLGQWLLNEPHYDLIQAHAMVAEAFRNELDEDEETRFAAYLTTRGVV